MCTEAKELLAERIKATQEHARLAKQLSDMATGKGPNLEFDAALGEVVRARDACHRARETLKSHQAEHDCWTRRAHT
jgi:hypothetical protein